MTLKTSVIYIIYYTVENYRFFSSLFSCLVVWVPCKNWPVELVRTRFFIIVTQAEQRLVKPWMRSVSIWRGWDRRRHRPRR